MLAWMTNSTNLIGLVTGTRGVHWEQAHALLIGLNPNIAANEVRRMEGILQATHSDYERGLLGDVQYGIYAETFDDFLDIAADFHRNGKVQESAVLVSAVLEDTFKKIAKRNGVDPHNDLEPTINDLAKVGVLSPVEAKRAKAYAGVRTAAFHARWDHLDLRSVGEAIKGVRGFIESHLA
jgi:hypothetical protein